MTLNKNPLRLEFIGQLPDSAINALADLLLSSSAPECELCGQYPQEHFIEVGEWQGRHCCTKCWESLTGRDDPAK